MTETLCPRYNTIFHIIYLYKHMRCLYATITCSRNSFPANISFVLGRIIAEEDKILHEIVKLESFKDLGVIFDSKLNFGEHTKE